MTLDTKFHLELLAEYSSAFDLASASSSLKFARQLNLATGTGAGQADVLWHDERTLAASASEDLDLAGALTGLLGGTVTFAKVKGLIVAAAAANTNSVVVGGAATNTFVGPFGAATHTIAVPPDGVLALLARGAGGLGAVTAGTGDLLKIANGGAGSSVTYQIVVIGTSA